MGAASRTEVIIMSRNGEKSRGDIYARITDRIIAELERGVRPWVQPWTAANMSGRITRPLRHNGQPYSGINVCCFGQKPSRAVSALRSG